MNLITALPLLFGLMLAGTGPKVSTPTPTLDYGQVFFGDTAKNTFVLENQGDEPLEILRAIPHCGCTVAKLRNPQTGEESAMPMITGSQPVAVLKPGEKFELVVGFNSLNQALGRIFKTIDVETNDRTTPKLTLTLSIDVKQAARVAPDTLKFGDVIEGEAHTLEARVTPTEGIDIKVVSVDPADHLDVAVESVEDEPPSAARPAGRRHDVVKVTLKADAPLGHFTRTLQLQTNHPVVKTLKLPVFARVLSVIKVETGNAFNSRLIDFGLLDAGVEAERVVEITNAHPDVPWTLKTAAIDSPQKDHFTATIETVAPGEHYRVKVKFDGMVDARAFKGKLLLSADHPTAPEVAVDLQGWIRK